MRYFIYARRSSEDKTKQIQSIPNQLEWAERKRVERGLDVIDTFTDTKTGTKPGREAFNAMVEAIEASPEPVGILCWKVNRLARNPIDEGVIKYAFIRGKIKHILASNQEFREGENQIIMGVEFGSATQYSIDLSHDIKRGMNRKVEQGWRPGVATLGYRNDPDGLKGDKRIFRNPATWDKVRRLWDLLLTEEYTVPELKWIANEELGLRTRYGAKLALSTVYDLFRNPFYAGFFNWRGRRVPGKHEPMVTVAEFERAEQIINGGKPLKRKHLPPWNGLIRCGECGCMITTEPPKVKIQQNGKRHVYHYLRCTKKNNEVRCGQPYLRQSELERQMEALLASIQFPREFAEWALDELQKSQAKDTQAFANERIQIKKQLNLEDAKLNTLTDKLLSGVITDRTYQNIQREHEKEQDRLQMALKQAEQQEGDLRVKAERLFDFAANALDSFRRGDKKTRRRIISNLGSNLQLKNRKLYVELHAGFQALQNLKISDQGENPPIEPLETHSSTVIRRGSALAFPDWRCALELIRTFLREDSGATLPVLDLTPQASSTSLLPREDDEEQGQNRNSHPAIETQRSQA